MSEFVFLYRGETDMKSLSPQEAQQSMQKWMAWFKELEKKGKLKSIGQPLERQLLRLLRAQALHEIGRAHV